jgi:hypothetical protein
MKFILILTTILTFSFAAQAQNDFTNPERMEELKKLLSLEDEQVAYLQKIEIGFRHSMSETVSNTEQGEERNKKIKDLMAQKQTQIEEVFTAEQLTKYNEYVKAQRMERSRAASRDLQQAREESIKLNTEDLKEGGKQ